MPNIIYYSSNCDNCIKLLNTIGNKKLENTLYFSVDTRETVNNQTFLILENGSRVLLPINITKVPSLLLIDDKTNKNTVKMGIEIYDYLNLNKQENVKEELEHEDISAFTLGGRMDNVVSDTFSYLSTAANDLLAEGAGGLEQLHNYSTLDMIHKINTPPDNYTPNKISNDGKSLEDLQKQREYELEGRT